MYMVGIGGIGMSGLAQLLKDHGNDVSGSDREASPVTELLESKGISVLIGQKAENVPPDAELVIYSEAVWEDNPERVRAKELGIQQISYFQGLGDISKGMKTVAVSGTHGKTTTTGMLARILRDAGASPTAIVGSLVKDFGSNYLKGDSNIFVVEACEYKRDFLTLSPHILVITNVEWDHTDYYKDLADFQSAFRTLAEKVPADGAIVTNPTHPNIASIVAGLSVPIIDYTREPAYATKLPGEFNVMNARAAAAAAKETYIAVKPPVIADSLASFEGTWRRFEYKGKTAKGAGVYDDYAHHPTAIRATLAEIRKKTTGKVIVAFHPHLYSRTRDLIDGFSSAFADADEVVIAPIYAAREVDDGTVSNRSLAELISKNGVAASAIDSFDDIGKHLDAHAAERDTIVLMGAGDIYKVASSLIAI